MAAGELFAINTGFYDYVYVFFVLIWRVVALYKNMQHNKYQITKFKLLLRINKLEPYQKLLITI